MKLKNNELLQFKTVYQSTLAFENFLKEELKKNITVLDIGCGTGGTLSYYVKKYQDIKFIGLDYREKKIVEAKRLYKIYNITNNIDFIKFDIYKSAKYKKIQKPDGIISEKTFCTFKDITIPLKNLFKLKPKWIAINSLFYKGEMDVFIHIKETKRIYEEFYKNNNPDGDFNIFSINKLSRFLKKTNYKITKIHEFFPKKKIISKKNYRGTYTMKTERNVNTCFSGPVYLPWYFILIKKV
jgi:cyclopropane fatty-acyl-phospholipid synthase-like methyltransferase